MSPTVIVLGGPNGAGKSTLARPLLSETLGLTEFVNADQIAKGLSAFNPEGVAMEAGRVMLKRLKDLAASESDFAFETTLATRSFAPWLRDLKVDKGYQVHIFYVWLRSADLAAARVRQRVRAGGHSVPARVVRWRYAASVANFRSLYAPLADAWRVYDNSQVGRPRLLASGSGESVGRVYDSAVWDAIWEAD